MKTLKWRLVMLVVWLGIFFNLERLDISGPNTINMASAVYVLGLLAALAPFVRRCQRRPLYMLVIPLLLLYLGTRLLDPAPFFGGVHTYLTFTEVSMLVVTLILAYRAGHAVDEFRQAVETLTLADIGKHLRTLSEAQELIEIEMLESRRMERELSLVVLQVEPSSLRLAVQKIIQDIQQVIMQRYVTALASKLLAPYLRRSDMIVAGSQAGRLVMVMPNTSQQGAMVLGQRVMQFIHEHLGVRPSIGTATFPAQGLTFEGLLQSAEQDLTKTDLSSSYSEQQEDILQSREQDMSANIALQVAMALGQQKAESGVEYHN